MSKNLTYEGKYKGYLRSPEQVVKDKKGHCWETSELANRELTAKEWEVTLATFKTRRAE